MYVSGRYAYVTSNLNDTLAIFDVSRPDNIVAKAFISTGLHDPRSVYVKGNMVFAASNGSSELLLYDIPHLDTPSLVSGNTATGYLDVTDSAIVGNNLHVQGALNVGPGGALVDGNLAVNNGVRVNGVIEAKDRITSSSNASSDRAVAMGDRWRDNAVAAWARVASDGTLSSDFGVSSVAHSTGIYTITVDVNAVSASDLIPVVIAEVDGPPTGAAAARLVTVNQRGPSTFVVYVTDGNYDLRNNDILFMVTGR